MVDQTWLQQYSWPTKITYDQGSEFIGHKFQTMIEQDYGIKTKPCTGRNHKQILY